MNNEVNYIGKIYGIKSRLTDKWYLGSTIQKDLSGPLCQHRVKKADYDCNMSSYSSSIEILKYPDYYIELIETIPCNDKKVIKRREAQLIRQYKDQLVNKS